MKNIYSEFLTQNFVLFLETTGCSSELAVKKVQLGKVKFSF